MKRSEFLKLGDAFETEEFLPGSWVRVEGGEKSPQGTLLSLEGQPPEAVTVLTSAGEQRAAFSEVRRLSSKTVSGISLTNAVTMSGKDTAEVYASFARFNHACVPNARAIQADGMRGVVATCDIEAGMEICVSYFEESKCLPAVGMQAIADRLGCDSEVLHVALVRQQLYSKWGFWCCCLRCSGYISEADDALARWLDLAGRK
eukprot:CAMPEP_0197644930 /NCGR_PEP_ID=MMETSP1338-20131121/17751_1 /TAXON_ID=43686 ORGANISM="Pelagodinium beii, Strain RCC1491" /NCGR_SAMPLE_ID=MMETSP1338 /ASSEMBLY_ACC=CAM_ASM_000754 /LENGTH=202 /DNA_ID=CAMNT_0043218413 /DNA_START=19 /DNA_END=627 /DNA_ORIENTATION=+